MAFNYESYPKYRQDCIRQEKLEKLEKEFDALFYGVDKAFKADEAIIKKEGKWTPEVEQMQDARKAKCMIALEEAYRQRLRKLALD